MNRKYQKPIVAIVGRPNVGKSTFFNRLCGKRKAIESEISGTTRDRIYENVNWCGKSFIAVDCAGLFENDKIDPFAEETKKAVISAISEAKIIVFLVDVNKVNDFDRKIAKLLHQSKKSILLVANKTDNQNMEITSKEILSLGFGNPHFLSAISGRNVGDFLDILTFNLTSNIDLTVEKEEEIINVAIFGRQNVGKSTLLNSLSNREKSIVSAVPGTTRDTVDEIVNFADKKIKIVDTAGIRKRGKIEQGIEKFSVLRAVSSLKKSQVVIIVIDAEEGLTNQDAHIAGIAKDEGKSIIVAINKFDIWDNLDEKKKKEKMAKFIHQLQNDLAFLPYVPVIFISAKEKNNLKILLKKIIEIYKERFVEIDENELAEIITEAKMSNPQLPANFSLYQEKTNPPIFKMKVRNKSRVHFSHLRYLENRIRDKFPYTGTPIFIDIIEK